MPYTFLTSDLLKVEFKTHPEQNNIAFKYNGGDTLLITGVPAGIASTLAMMAQYQPPAFAAKTIYVELDKTPTQAGENYYEAAYDGRIEIRA
jgi:hypothetical protein